MSPQEDHDLLIKLNQCVMDFRGEVNKKLDVINCANQRNECASRFLTVDRHEEIEKQKTRSMKYMVTIVGIIVSILTIVSFFNVNFNRPPQEVPTSVADGNQPQ